jgi:type VI secretion system protein ImpF
MSRSDRFLPALLDRLVESPGSEGAWLSRRAYQQSVLRDLQWLLCTVAPREHARLAGHDHARRSVLNYGVPCSTGMSLTEQELKTLAQDIEKAILTFEPRVLPESLSVTLMSDSREAVRSQLVFRIRLAFWFEPYPLELSVRAQWDIENGLVSLSGE